MRWAAEADQPRTCTTQEGRAQWFEDFADKMDDYKRLGRVIDALRCLTTTDGVESRIVTNMQPIRGRYRKELAPLHPLVTKRMEGNIPGGAARIPIHPLTLLHLKRINLSSSS